MYTMMPYRSRRDSNALRRSPLFDDRLFRSFFDMNDWMGNVGFRVDIRDLKDRYLLEAEMPGVAEDQINLTVDNDVLTISADLAAHDEQESDRCCYSERRSGHIERSFNLEGISQDGITADYKNGMLYVTLPKEQPEPPKTARKIAIGCGEAKPNQNN